MTPEAIIEAFARGLVTALLSSSAPQSKGPRQTSRRRAPAARRVSHRTPEPPSLFDTPAIQTQDTGLIPPPSAEELDRLLKGLQEGDIDRALHGSDPPGTYRPDEGVTPWIGSGEHTG